MGAGRGSYKTPDYFSVGDTIRFAVNGQRVVVSNHVPDGHLYVIDPQDSPFTQMIRQRTKDGYGNKSPWTDYKWEWHEKDDTFRPPADPTDVIGPPHPAATLGPSLCSKHGIPRCPCFNKEKRIYNDQQAGVITQQELQKWLEEVFDHTPKPKFFQSSVRKPDPYRRLARGNLGRK